MHTTRRVVCAMRCLSYEGRERFNIGSVFLKVSCILSVRVHHSTHHNAAVLISINRLPVRCTLCRAPQTGIQLYYVM
jgi:hypothetical protein